MQRGVLGFTAGSINSYTMQMKLTQWSIRRLAASARCGSVLVGLLLVMASCNSQDKLFPELDSDAFVSPEASMAWEPARNVGYEPGKVAPLGQLKGALNFVLDKNIPFSKNMRAYVDRILAVTE